MKIALVQFNPIIGDLEGNFQKISRFLIDADKQQADLVIFPELSLCGYPPLDLLERPDFIDSCQEYLEKLKELSGSISFIIGAPGQSTEAGKKLYNSAYWFDNHQLLKRIDKKLLPTYDVFDEARYFEPGKGKNLVKFKNHRIAVTICEDLWDPAHNHYKGIHPLDGEEQPELIINISASPFSTNQAKKRMHILTENSKKWHCPILYVNQSGAHTELIFDGYSGMIDKHGHWQQLGNYFTEELIFLNPFKDEIRKQVEEHKDLEILEKALVTGIRDYFKKLNFSECILGLSGGIDSALVAYLAVEALGADKVKGYMLPSRFSSDHSISDAKELAQNLGIETHEITIEPLFEASLKVLEPQFHGKPFNVAEENLQSRMRGVLLMALSNKFGSLLINTTNKSEMAVGYGTLYGDMCGAISVLGDIYKTQVFELCRFINRYQKFIPENIINKPPSAELRPDQKDSDSLPDYDTLDRLLFNHIEMRKDRKSLLEEGFNAQTIDKVLRLVKISEHKRYQAAPVLRISEKAFGTGRRIPIVSK